MTSYSLLNSMTTFKVNPRLKLWSNPGGLPGGMIAVGIDWYIKPTFLYSTFVPTLSPNYLIYLHHSVTVPSNAITDAEASVTN